MALYSFSIQTISRSTGNSTLKAAAYQARETLYDEHGDPIKKPKDKADLLYANIFLPKNAPPEFFDRQKLWNAAEKAEKRYDARTGRVVTAALPNELTLAEQINLVKEFVSETFVNYGMCADVAIHSGIREMEPPADNPPDTVLPNNPHTHILLTDRPVDGDGFCTKKNRDWNKKAHLLQWRQSWAEIQNREFERKKLKVRISHESLEAQQIDREPTKHLGRAVTEMNRRGMETERGKENRAIEARNRERLAYRHRQLEQTKTHEMSRSR